MCNVRIPLGLFSLPKAGFRAMINICLNGAAEPSVNLHNGTSGDVLHGNYCYLQLHKAGL